DLDISAAIFNLGGGTAGVIKAGAGTLRYSGSVSNTYNGLTTVQDGVLELNHNLNNAALVGNLQIGDRRRAANSPVVRLLQAGEIPDASAVTVNADGRFDLNNFNEAIGPLTVNGGNVTAGGGNLFVNGLVSMTGGSISSSASGAILLVGDVTSN